MEDVNVEELVDDWGKPLLKVTTPKFKQHFEVYKTEDGFAFFGIRTVGSNQNPALAGVWTRPEEALKHLKAFISNAKPSVAVKRDKKYKENHPEAA